MLEKEINHAEAAIQYSTFYVAGIFFGIDVLKVQEVLRYQQMTRVPLSPGVVQGLINLRGQIVTALDIRERMNLKPRMENQMPMNVVVRSDKGIVSLLVDEISDVLSVNKDLFEPPPPSLPSEQQNLIEGLYKLDSRLLLILDIERVLDV